MNNPVSADIKSLFERYEIYSREGSYKKVATLYGRWLIAAAPAGIVLHRNNWLTRWFFARGMTSFYRKAGMTGIKLLFMSEMIICEGFSLVKVRWGSTFTKTGDRLVEYDISYLVCSIGAKPEIMLFISHEDEQKSLTRLGVFS